MNRIDPLSADAGADFVGVIDRTRDGAWRAVATAHKRGGTVLHEEYIGIKTFASEDAAYDWLKKEATDRGFRNVQITTRTGTR